MSDTLTRHVFAGFEIGTSQVNIVKRVFNNISLVLIAQAVSHVFSFFYFIIMARSLGPNDFGIFSFALVLTGVLSVIADAGIRKVQIRDMARYSDDIVEYFNKTIFLKAICIFCVFSFILVWVYYYNYTDLTKKIIVLLSFAAIFDSFSQSFFGVFQAKQILRYEAVALIGRSFLLLAGAFFVLRA